jgi:hypothetical protein
MLAELRMPGLEASAGLLVAGVLIGVIAGSAGTLAAGGGDSESGEISSMGAEIATGRRV